MKIRRRDVIKAATGSAVVAATTRITGRSAWASAPTRIVRDVCILGGGSAGTYTAVQLRNLGKSVVVLEKKDRLGGHAETVVVDGFPINIGVQVFESSNPLVTSYFSQLGVPLLQIPLGGGPAAANVDFRTGASVSVPSPTPAALDTAIGTYLEVLETKYPYLDSGFNLPSPVPQDLLLPFGEFVTKYGLQALVADAFAFSQGVGDMLADPALYVLKNFSLSVVGAIATDSFAIVPTGTASLYDAAAAFLGADAVLNAQILAAVRTPGGVEVLVDTPNGPVIVQAGKLVVAFPPTLSNLAPLALDASELALFGQFGANYYATSLVQVAGLPPGVALTGADPNTPYNLPRFPGLYGLQVTEVPGYYVALYGNTSWLPDDFVQADIATSIERLASSAFPGAKFGGFTAFSSHAPFEMMVSPGDIAAGFYTQLNALQGRNLTYYTGAAFQTNDSSLIWTFTQGLLPEIAA